MVCTVFTLLPRITHDPSSIVELRTVVINAVKEDEAASSKIFTEIVQVKYGRKVIQTPIRFVHMRIPVTCPVLSSFS